MNTLRRVLMALGIAAVAYATAAPWRMETWRSGTRRGSSFTNAAARRPSNAPLLLLIPTQRCTTETASAGSRFRGLACR